MVGDLGSRIGYNNELEQNKQRCFPRVPRRWIQGENIPKQRLWSGMEIKAKMSNGANQLSERFQDMIRNCSKKMDSRETFSIHWLWSEIGMKAMMAHGAN